MLNFAVDVILRLWDTAWIVSMFFLGWINAYNQKITFDSIHQWPSRMLRLLGTPLLCFFFYGFSVHGGSGDQENLDYDMNGLTEKQWQLAYEKGRHESAVAWFTCGLAGMVGTLAAWGLTKDPSKIDMAREGNE